MVLIWNQKSPHYSRARSIKTRIETQEEGFTHAPVIYSRARSIKTRIETNSEEDTLPSWQIREQDPLKQGLKLSFFVTLIVILS